MKKLSEVANFGGISAEDDPNLRRYFVKTPVFEDLRAGSKQIVIGRKGSGKTALYLALIDKAPEYRHEAIGLKFKNYPWGLQQRYESQDGDRHVRFYESWRFLILLEIFKRIIQLGPNNRSVYTEPAHSTAETAIKQVEKFVNNNWGQSQFDFKKTFPEGGFRVEGFELKPSIGAKGLAASVGGVSAKMHDSSRLGETLTRLTEWLWNCLKAVGSGTKPIFVLFDELDLGFDPASADYVDRIIGLLLAIRDLTKEFRTCILPYKLIGFLRTDIYDALHFGDKNKLTEANVVTLAWNDDLDYHDCSLKELIDHRIREEFQSDMTVKDPWTLAFDEQLMRGTQHKFNHITSRTYLRPRDTIKFCNLALDIARTRMRSTRSDVSSKIINDDITQSRASYSQYMLRELDNEIAPSFKNWQNYLEILRKIGFQKFTYARFASAYEELKDRVQFTLSVGEILQELFYKYSIVGFERIGRTKGAGYYYHYSYFDETIRFDPSARSFMVHAGLKEALELAESADPAA